MISDKLLKCVVLLLRERRLTGQFPTYQEYVAAREASDAALRDAGINPDSKGVDMATVEGLCDEMKAARIEEFGDDDGSQRLPSVFFRTGLGAEAAITVTAPDGRISHRNPEYCATEVGGARLGNVVNELGFTCEVVPGPAVELLGNWKESDTVPWIKLAQGPKLNAGQLLMFFNHNYPAAQVEKKLKQEINDALGHDSGTDRV